MKGGGIKKLEDVRYPAFLGAILDILLRCIERKEEKGVVVKGYYTEQLSYVIGKGAYDADGHRNAKFLGEAGIGPYPGSMQRAWAHLRGDASLNYGLTLASTQQEWGKLGPLSNLTPADAMNRGAAARKTGPVQSSGQRRGQSTGEPTHDTCQNS